MIRSRAWLLAPGRARDERRGFEPLYGVSQLGSVEPFLRLRLTQPAFVTAFVPIPAAVRAGASAPKRRYARPRPPEQRRQALALLDEGLTPGEVARRTLIPASTVKSWARKRRVAA